MLKRSLFFVECVSFLQPHSGHCTKEGTAILFANQKSFFNASNPNPLICLTPLVTIDLQKQVSPNSFAKFFSLNVLK